MVLTLLRVDGISIPEQMVQITEHPLNCEFSGRLPPKRHPNRRSDNRAFAAQMEEQRVADHPNGIMSEYCGFRKKGVLHPLSATLDPSLNSWPGYDKSCRPETAAERSRSWPDRESLT